MVGLCGEQGPTEEQAGEREKLVKCIERAGCKQHLSREKALSEISAIVEHDVSVSVKNSESEESTMVSEGLELLQVESRAMMGQSEEWERRLGGLRLANILVQKGGASSVYMLCLLEDCLGLLEDGEVRVRWAVGELLGELSKVLGVAVWDVTGERILESIERNYMRDDVEASSTMPADSKDFESNKDGNNPIIASMLQQSYAVQKPGEGEMRHGTEGWKCLETSFRALEHIMKGCGDAFRPCLTDEILNLIYKSLKHPNRFVREICQFIMGTICHMLGEDEVYGRHVEIASKLGFGLSDNWSQVRYAASVATRTFVMVSKSHRDEVLPLIVPHMCLNRYYVAEGVRLYSQETWRLAVGDKGREWVAKCINNVVSYYVEQSGANNHAVREAACACIAELMTKVDKEAVSPHVPRLLKSLLVCFRDASWPVRDAACLATGRCVIAFPEESRDILDKLYDLWFAHLEENIFSVREDSAVALGNAARAYGQEAVDKIVPRLKVMLPKAKDQKPDSKTLSKLENVTTFGVAAERSMRANDQELHTDQTMFSCGSLAPKLKRGADCCGDYGLNRPAEPWESSDGSVYLLRELSGIVPAAVVEFIPVLADLANLTHFAHCLTLHETIWKCLPIIAQNIGKKDFKSHLELFLDPLFKDLHCGHRLCEAAAGQSLSQLRRLIGPGVFAGRLTKEQQELMDRSQFVC